MPAQIRQGFQVFFTLGVEVTYVEAMEHKTLTPRKLNRARDDNHCRLFYDSVWVECCTCAQRCISFIKTEGVQLSGAQGNPSPKLKTHRNEPLFLGGGSTSQNKNETKTKQKSTKTDQTPAGGPFGQRGFNTRTLIFSMLRIALRYLKYV